MSNRVEGQKRAPDDDSELVSSCQKGDVDAFSVLVEKHQKRMFNIAYRIVGDYEDACEILQETFLAAFRSMKKFRGEARFSTWLCGICINMARNRLKQTRNRSRHEVPSLDDPVEARDGSLIREPASDDPPILDHLERKEMQVRVQQCINALDEEYREVLVLRDIQEFSYEEIRDILKIPEGTVKSRLFRARDILRSSLKKDLGDS